MENEMTNDSNPALIDIYLKALLMRESSGNYEAKHKASVIEDFATGKPIRVQALGGYGILDINFQKWAKQAGLKDFSMEDEDWKDPVAQDTTAKYKVQEYFNKYGSWDAVSVAWFSGEGNANQLVKNGTIDYSQADSNGVNIEDYVASINNLISEELMNMEVPIETFTPPQIISGPQTNPVVDSQRNQQEVFAAQILDSMTKANAGGMRPSFDSQVPAGAGRFEDAVVEAQTKRGDIGKPPVEQVSQYAQTVEQAFQQYLDAVNNG
jgi:hypothetical protein